MDKKDVNQKEIYLYVGISGAIGAVLRYSLGLIIPGDWIGIGLFPFATFLANIIGCFFLGWVTAQAQMLKKIHPYLFIVIGTGLIGSFTTFSTFSVETITLMKESHPEIAFLYIGLSLVIGLLMAALGNQFGHLTKKGRA